MRSPFCLYLSNHNWWQGTLPVFHLLVYKHSCHRRYKKLQQTWRWPIDRDRLSGLACIPFCCVLSNHNVCPRTKTRFNFQLFSNYLPWLVDHHPVYTYIDWDRYILRLQKRQFPQYKNMPVRNPFCWI